MTLPENVLVTLFEGAPVHFAYEVVDARDFLADVLEEHGDSYQVYKVFIDGTVAQDITKSFADEWAGDLGYGDGDEPDEFLRTFTGFVVAHLREELIAEFRQAEEYRDNERFERDKVRSL